MDTLITILIGAGKFLIGLIILLPFIIAMLGDGYDDYANEENKLLKFYFYYYPISLMVAVVIGLLIFSFYVIGKA